MKVVIIDDEQPARELIKVYLAELEDMTLVGEASNGFDGVKLIQRTQPNLILLDIQMPKINGFEMLELIDEPPAVIFCTAYDDYAIRAFEKNAIDYLLKPFSKSRFIRAVSKVKPGNRDNNRRKLPELLAFEQHLNRIVVKTGQRIDIVDVADILYLEAQDDYVELHTAEQKLLKQQTMKYYEKALDGQRFVRIHRKYIVNVNAIDKLDKYGRDSYLAQLKTGAQLNISAAGYARLKMVLHM
jgi:two-component system LytT family response regulator